MDVEKQADVARQSTSEKPMYKIGDITRASGHKIENIYGQTDDVVVFLLTDKSVGFEISGRPIPRQHRAMQEYNRLADEVRRSLPQSQRERFRDELAGALYIALTEDDEAKALSTFCDCESTLRVAALYQARLVYVVAGFIIALASGGVLGYLLVYLAPAGVTQTLALGALAGIAGALTSVLIRSASLALGAFEASPHYAFQGATRIVLGGLFGLFTAIAAKANLVLGFAFDNVWVMVVLTFFAGFSERFVPELLKSLEDRQPTLAGGTTSKSDGPAAK